MGETQPSTRMTQRHWSELNGEILNCRKCPRLVAWRESIACTRRRAFMHEEYWGKPVPGFGDIAAKILVVGLAPGAHGSNRTGRMFTGDSSGNFLYTALFRAGFANQPQSQHRADNLELSDLFISALCRCVPPQNKPTLQEINTCLEYLKREIGFLHNLEGIVALGRVAFESVHKLYQEDGRRSEAHKFIHAGLYHLGEDLPWLLAAYHPSRQNTQTGRLTVEMFDQVWKTARNLLENR